MFKCTRRGVTAVLMASAIVISPVFVPLQKAFATNKGTVNGDTTQACTVNWRAESMMSADASQYPSDLLVNVDGTEVLGGAAGGNGGFISEVSPLFGSKGKMEIQHYYNGSEGTNDLTANFRIFIGTGSPINNATLTMNLPANYTWSMSDNTAWGARFAAKNNLPYTGHGSFTQTTTNTFNLSLAANQEVTIVFTAAAPTSTEVLKASANLTGTYAIGQGCESTIPSGPIITPVGPCEFATYGRTTRLLGATDISTREKFTADGALITPTTPHDGEINADGFDNIYRLYAATKTDLTNVRLTWTPTQGFRFNQAIAEGIYTGNDGKGNTKMGQLYNNGYTVAVPGIGSLAPTLNTDGSISLVIPQMPANSAIAFSVLFTLDGTGSTMAMNETMLGDKASCPGSISGIVYWDNDQSQAISDADAPYISKPVYLVDQTTGLVVATTTSDENGDYIFTNVPEGTYTVYIIPTTNSEIPTTPKKISDITVGRGQDVTDVDFGLFKPGKGDVSTPTPITPAPTSADTSTIAKTTTASALPIPTQLPETGASWDGLVISLVAALSTYGIVYFAQGKRRI